MVCNLEYRGDEEEVEQLIKECKDKKNHSATDSLSHKKMLRYDWPSYGLENWFSTIFSISVYMFKCSKEI